MQSYLVFVFGCEPNIGLGRGYAGNWRFFDGVEAASGASNMRHSDRTFVVAIGTESLCAGGSAPLLYFLFKLFAECPSNRDLGSANRNHLCFNPLDARQRHNM